MNNKLTSILLIGLILLTGCSLSGTTSPTPTASASAPLVFITTETPSPIAPVVVAPVVTATASLMPLVAANVCSDAQVTALIDSLKRAMLNQDGTLLSSLVSPSGMEVRWVRYGNIITYTRDQAPYLFETTFEANWGDEPGSGAPKQGAFHDVIVPEMVKVFNQPYTLHCNEIKHGGASYDITWPYKKDFYSIYYTGTDANGLLDWHTWAVGVEYVNGKPFIYALIQYFWEP